MLRFVGAAVLLVGCGASSADRALFESSPRGDGGALAAAAGGEAPDTLSSGGEPPGVGGGSPAAGGALSPISGGKTGGAAQTAGGFAAAGSSAGTAAGGPAHSTGGGNGGTGGAAGGAAGTLAGGSGGMVSGSACKKYEFTCFEWSSGHHTCAGEACVSCPLSQLDCNEDSADGCEIWEYSTSNCGGCGVQCAASQKCVSRAGSVQCE